MRIETIYRVIFDLEYDSQKHEDKLCEFIHSLELNCPEVWADFHIEESCMILFSFDEKAIAKAGKIFIEYIKRVKGITIVQPE